MIHGTMNVKINVAVYYIQIVNYIYCNYLTNFEIYSGMWVSLHAESVIVVRFIRFLILSRDFSKNLITKFHKNFSAGVEFF
jgi:hypothetical protein